jgi:hypothetical protein
MSGVTLRPGSAPPRTAEGLLTLSMSRCNSSAVFPLALVIVVCAAIAKGQAIGPPPGDLESADGEPTLTPVLRWGESSAEAIEQVQDYTARLIKRERIRGRLERSKQLFIKIRHKPLSIYARFETTTGTVTQEVLYVHGKNRNRMWVHSEKRKLIGTVSVYPSSRLALREGRYPITEIGILPLTQELVKHVQQAIGVDGTQVKLYRDATIDGRPTLALVVTHEQPHKDLNYHHARVFIDREWNVPVRYEAYGFPNKPGGPPRLEEQYTYLDLAFNVGLTDDDFDLRNPQYSFPIPKSMQSPSPGVRPVPAQETKPVEPTPAPRQTIAADFKSRAAAANERLSSSPSYTCVVVRRREVGDRLNPGEFHRLKYRTQPQALYVRGLWPADVQQQRLLYVANQNGGFAVARLSDALGGLRLTPGDLRNRMQESRSVTELNIGAQLAEAVTLAQGGATFRRFPNARVDARPCICFEILRRSDGANRAATVGRVYFDQQKRLPIRFETYMVAANGSRTPRLVEAVTYRNVSLGARLSPRDFDALNPTYGFTSAPVAATIDR